MHTNETNQMTATKKKQIKNKIQHTYKQKEVGTKKPKTGQNRKMDN